MNKDKYAEKKYKEIVRMNKSLLNTKEKIRKNVHKAGRLEEQSNPRARYYWNRVDKFAGKHETKSRKVNRLQKEYFHLSH